LASAFEPVGATHWNVHGVLLVVNDDVLVVQERVVAGDVDLEP
jgi:hypothetical protein